MYGQIEKSIRQLLELDSAEFDLFRSKLQVKQLKRKELLLRDGQVCQHSYFINNGCLRYYYNIDGQEVTGQFFFENSWYTDYVSYLSGKPSTQYIEALERTEVIVLSKGDLEKLFREIPKFERFGRLMAERAFLGLHQRTEMLTNLNPEERYLKLMSDRPKVFERIPQHYIASYLGIKPPSLSRIRRRIFENR